MARKVKASPQKSVRGAPETEALETPPDIALLDPSDATVRKMIKTAKERGYVAYENLNAVFSSEKITSEQIEDTLVMLNEMGINVVESGETEAEAEEAHAEEHREEPEEEKPDGELAEVARTTPAKTEKSELAERTDDPVRMYLREMGSVELLSREGEIAVAKRIEASREAVIASLCESPLTFQAIIIWRDELKEGKVFLRDIIDLEATYAGPDAKPTLGTPGAGVPAAPAGASLVPGAIVAGPPVATAVMPPPVAAPPAAPVGPTPFQPSPGANGHGASGHGANGEASE